MFSSVSLPPFLSENTGIAVPGLMLGALLSHLVSHSGSVALRRWSSAVIGPLVPISERFGAVGSVLACQAVNEWQVVHACCGLLLVSASPPSAPVGAFGGSGVCGLASRPASARTSATS